MWKEVQVILLEFKVRCEAWILVTVAWLVQYREGASQYIPIEPCSHRDPTTKFSGSGIRMSCRDSSRHVAGDRFTVEMLQAETACPACCNIVPEQMGQDIFQELVPDRRKLRIGHRQSPVRFRKAIYIVCGAHFCPEARAY